MIEQISVGIVIGAGGILILGIAFVLIVGAWRTMKKRTALDLLSIMHPVTEAKSIVPPPKPPVGRPVQPRKSAGKPAGDCVECEVGKMTAIRGDVVPGPRGPVQRVLKKCANCGATRWFNLT